jgi:hypothetical protein
MIIADAMHQISAQLQHLRLVVTEGDDGVVEAGALCVDDVDRGAEFVGLVHLGERAAREFGHVAVERLRPVSAPDVVQHPLAHAGAGGELGG